MYETLFKFCSKFELLILLILVIVFNLNVSYLISVCLTLAKHWIYKRTNMRQIYNISKCERTELDSIYIPKYVYIV